MNDRLVANTDKKHSAVSEITPQEVAFYHENGWVFLPGLVEAELCKAAAPAARDMTERVRLSYVCTFAPADVRYRESHLAGNTGAKRTVPDSDHYPIIHDHCCVQRHEATPPSAKV